jgi:hypothetical protein
VNVLSTKPGSDGKGFVKLRLDDGSELEAWTPELDKVLALGEKPIPSDWVLKDNKQGTGKVFLPPRQQGQTAYRNTKEAFDREAESRARWQVEEENRKDKRTALMTAAEHFGNLWPTAAEEMYAWLRSSPAVGPHSGVATKGESAIGPATSPAGDTSLASGETGPNQPGPGEADADTKPGEGQPKPSSGFPIDAALCDHHLRSGNWVRWAKIAPDFTDRCPKCGTPKLVAMEGTNADLGPA